MTPLHAIIKSKCINIAATAKKNGMRREAMYSVIKGNNVQIKSLKRVLNMLPLTKAEREKVILGYFED